MALPFIEQQITRDAVLKLLIRYRCKAAEQVQKKQVVENLAVKSEVKSRDGQNDEMYRIFPPRRKWVHVSFDKRKKLSQLDKNKLNLLFTVKREEKKDGKHPEWYELLNKRISHIVKASLTSDCLFACPEVGLVEKKRSGKTIECRPVCRFKTLDERVYASLYNKVFTVLFDDLFYEKSFAFRVPQLGDGMMHLKAVRTIKEFRKSHQGLLWVAECDMKKFYDTLDHDIVKQRFSQLLLKKKQEKEITSDEVRVLKKVINSYLNCYCFYREVYSLNDKPNHPVWKSIKNGKNYDKVIRWILDDIKKKRICGEWPYRTKRHEEFQLGVPQGGALSGVIANVVMHFTDMKLRKYWENDREFLYIRFCDDMIMMGVDKMKLALVFEQYGKSIVRNHLYMHPPVPLKDKRMKSFWEGKTRPPYSWGDPAEDVMPWITFVGYDINWEGNTRIRRSTLKKEIKKQYDKKVEVERLLNNDKGGRNPQWTKQYISNSVQKRMIGMSVGRVQIWDYKNFHNNYSWAKAFTELTNNKWSNEQLKLLDGHRNKMMKQLNRFLLKLDYKDIKPSDKRERNDALWYYGKPFSYYGQVLKKWT